MALRPFRLPADLDTLITLIPPSFQYPENQAWSIQADEAEGLVDTLTGIRRVWPLVRVLQWVSPPLRDVLRGYVWEEDGQAVGLTNVLRMGATDRWMIGNVSVLPDYRRHGIGRQLVEASVEYARGRGAKAIVLDVVVGNLPAQTLYERLGFVTYSGQVSLMHDGNAAPEAVPLLPGYTVVPRSTFDWRPAYTLARRITPDAEQRFTPVEEGQFRRPWLLRPLSPLLTRAQGVAVRSLAGHQAVDGQIVAVATRIVRTRPGGVNSIHITLDPAHPALAPHLVRRLLAEIGQASPGRRVECDVRTWQAPVIAAAREAGFVERSQYLTMGLIV